MNEINVIKNYLVRVLGVDVHIEMSATNVEWDLPLHIRSSYRIHRTHLFGRTVLMLEPIEDERFRVSLIFANLEEVRKRSGYSVVLLLSHCSSIQRSRLIEKKIGFIVPGTQLYLPEFLVDLREVFPTKKANGIRLSPSSQFLLTFHLLHSSDRIEFASHNYKFISEWTGYSPMAITLAAENLKELDLIDVLGKKDKHMIFKLEKRELWQRVLSAGLLRTPVKESIFVDQFPERMRLLRSNVSALSDYSDLDSGMQEHFAISSFDYQTIKRGNAFKNLNREEGKFCLEVWKYHPGRIWGNAESIHKVVDPISLYASMQDSDDARVEMALEQMIQEIQW
ncbi:MAG: hypothetical protein R2751_08220 [Bacteroidales bacterium]